MNKPNSLLDGSSSRNSNKLHSIYPAATAITLAVIIVLLVWFNSGINNRLGVAGPVSRARTMMEDLKPETRDEADLAKRAGFGSYIAYKKNRDQCFESKWRHCKNVMGEYKVLRTNFSGENNNIAKEKERADFMQERSRYCFVQEKQAAEERAAQQTSFDQLQIRLKKAIKKSDQTQTVNELLEKSKNIAKAMMFAESAQLLRECEVSFARQNNICVISAYDGGATLSPGTIKQKCENKMAEENRISNI